MRSRAVVDAFEPGEFRPPPALSERPLMGRAATVEFGGRDETGANYIASTQFAVDAEVEQCEFARSMIKL